MSETKRMADEANRIGQQAQERFQTGFEAASRSLSEANKGFQAMADELTDFSKRGSVSSLGATPPCAAFRRRSRSPDPVCPAGL